MPAVALPRFALRRFALRRFPPLTACALALLAAAPASRAEPVAYGLDLTHTFVHWEVLHMGTSTSRGRFDKLEGSVSFDAKDKALDIGITVATDSITTGAAAFDAVLKGASLLNAKEHPQAWFVARRATFEGDTLKQVHGEFTLRGVSQPLTLRATRWRCALNPLFQREVCGGDFEATIKRSDFGMTLALPLVADDVKLLVQVEGVRGGVPQ
jgi:polyisoprenoid-binding protein YceI